MAENLCDDLEFWYRTIRLREAGAGAVLPGTGDARYKGKHGLPVEADGPVESARARDLNAPVISGGKAPERLHRSQAVLDLVRDMDRAGKLIASICHAGSVPASAGVLNARIVGARLSGNRSNGDSPD
jgi:protease I